MLSSESFRERGVSVCSRPKASCLKASRKDSAEMLACSACSTCSRNIGMLAAGHGFYLEQLHKVTKVEAAQTRGNCCAQHSFWERNRRISVLLTESRRYGSLYRL
jgi:hypothetical protein